MSDPYCLAMVLCDYVHRDIISGKQTIVGTFSALRVESFPAKLELWVYFAITDVTGEFDLTLRIAGSDHVFSDDTVPVAEVTISPLQSPGPLAVCEGAIHIKSVQFEKPGVYHCELFSRGDLLMSRRLAVVQKPGIESEQ